MPYSEFYIVFSPRFTLGGLRIDAMQGHLTMDTESNIRINRLGEPGHAIDRTRQSLNFASDCVFTTPRHFVNCFLSGEE